MSTTTQSLSHEFTVSSVSGVQDLDTILNVTKRKERVFFHSSVRAADANVSYVSSLEVTSDTNLSIADRSTALISNREHAPTAGTVSDTKKFSIETENFIITDIYADSSESINATPLFFKHTLSSILLPRDVNGDIDTGVTLIEVKILDLFFQPIKVAEMKIDYTEGVVYNNLESYHTASSDYNAYYVRYTVNNNGVVSTYVDILDNTNIYELADFNDLDETLTLLTDGRKVYLLDEMDGAFQVTLPVIGTYSYKPTSSSRLKVVSPVSSNAEDYWFVRVTNGSFLANVDGIKKYYVAEFLDQSFYPEVPIKVSTEEESTVLAKNLVKLDYLNIHEDDDFELYVQIMINDKDGNGVAAFTTDASIVGIVSDNGKPWVQWSETTRVGIKSIDHKTGFVDIEGLNLKSSYEIVSTYYYVEEMYEYSLINFNPVSNHEILKQKVAIFVIPETTSTLTQSLFYLKIDETGRVIESNWSSFNNVTRTLSGNPLYYEAFPSWKTPEAHTIFVDTYTVEGSGTYLILADITSAPATKVGALELIDSRRRGGGIIEGSFSEVVAANPEAQFVWDEGYWDGIPYPGNASIYVEVPVDVLEDAGGEFTQQEVRDVVNKHIAAGVYPVTKAYGVDVLVSGIYPSENSITIAWNSNEY